MSNFGKLQYKIQDILQVEDVTSKYEEGVRLLYPDYKAEEPWLQVTVKTTCYGKLDINKYIWKESEFQQYKKQGWFEK